MELALLTYYTAAGAKKNEMLFFLAVKNLSGPHPLLEVYSGGI
jgi:hypothetical protein